jgi:3'-5' exoribonuclease
MAAQRIFVQDIRDGMAIDQVFVVHAKDLRTTKSGDLYISGKLGDRTGQIDVRMWQASEAVYNGIPLHGYLHVKGRAEDYKGTAQLVIASCRPVDPSKVDQGDYVAVSPYDIEEMWAEVTEILRTIHDRHIKALLKKFLEDKALVAAIKRSPAAVQMHQPYVGGLLEHTRNVLRGCRAILPLYPQLNGDLLLAGAFLHDLGKSGELAGGLANSYTDRGMLVGHITMAAVWVQDKARLVAEDLGESFPPQRINLLQHLILAHHGEHQWGSPKLPAIPEAFVLHYLDNLDAKMWMAAHAIEADPDDTSAWTPYARALETRLFKHSGPDRADGSDDDAPGELFEQSG